MCFVFFIVKVIYKVIIYYVYGLYVGIVDGCVDEIKVVFF